MLDKTIQIPISLDMKLKDQSGAPHSPTIATLHDERNIFSFSAIFSGSKYRAGGSAYEVPYPCLYTCDSQMLTLANIEDPDKIPHGATFHQGLFANKLCIQC